MGLFYEHRFAVLITIIIAFIMENLEKESFELFASADRYFNCFSRLHICFVFSRLHRCFTHLRNTFESSRKYFWAKLFLHLDVIGGFRCLRLCVPMLGSHTFTSFFRSSSGLGRNPCHCQTHQNQTHT